ncbi:hypothetical protein H5201_09590 [Pseudoalteromonas sp. SG43-6]|uniref:hypothetical protein n=1 Tax=Pseudoalteromonas sp. SG43-6 TaxID=2760967 RepID=UPI001603E3FD|nr:hypothetical protein [Pseudoalteromonas sp. SG43-6]MBB1434560.1 hypothetical protein [Pseudoalteromonas sp. SG43-6]
MTIEFKETDDGVSFLINGKEVTFFIKNTDNSQTLRNDFELDNDEIDELLELEYSELPLDFEYYKEDYIKINGASIDLCIAEYHLGFRVKHELEIWANHYSFKKFDIVFEGLLSQGSFKVINYNDSQIDVDLDIDRLEYQNQSMLANVKKALDFIEECSLEAHKFLTEQSRDDVFIKVFEFPPEYKNICSQYLIWFGEFLQNLGIDANVSTNQRKNQTQLIVSPNECPELLTEIEKLFYQYLSLPYAELLPPESNLTPQELHAYQAVKMQVQHLQTQVQLKDYVIASYQATNTDLMNKISEKDSELMLINSLKEDNKFEIFGGILKVNKVQKIGKNDNASIDLCKIYKLLNKK